MPDDRCLRISNEFASIEIRLESSANGAIALFTDRRTGASRQVDVLALEGLVWAPDAILAALADPVLFELPTDQECHVVWHKPE